MVVTALIRGSVISICVQSPKKSVYKIIALKTIKNIFSQLALIIYLQHENVQWSDLLYNSCLRFSTLILLQPISCYIRELLHILDGGYMYFFTAVNCENWKQVVHSWSEVCHKRQLLLSSNWSVSLQAETMLSSI